MRATAGKTQKKAQPALHWLRHALKQNLMTRNLLRHWQRHLPKREDGRGRRQYESIVHADPSRIQSWLGLGLVHARSGHLKASALLSKSALYQSKRTPAKANLLTIFKQTGEFEKPKP